MKVQRLGRPMSRGRQARARVTEHSRVGTLSSGASNASRELEGRTEIAPDPQKRSVFEMTAG